MKNKLIYIIPFITIFIVSCFKEDEPLQPYPGEVSTIENHIEKFQSYYDFESDSVSCYHRSDEWTLGFGCGENELLISTNSGNNWFIYNTKQSDLNATIDYPYNKIWDYDLQKFFPTYTAISNWVNISDNDTTFTGIVFLLGKFNGSTYSDIYRLKILKADKHEYVFCYQSEYLAEQSDTFAVQKSPSKNFVYFSFTDFAVKDLEPEKSTYDIVFGPYYDSVTQIGVTAPYLVRGVLLNYGSVAAIDSITDFKSINTNDFSSSDFFSQRNFIGYNWKNVLIDQSASSASYSVRSDYNYMIKTQEGNYFKFRFVSYSLNGENGYPSFEVEKINR
jgi:hypothetical protein